MRMNHARLGARCQSDVSGIRYRQAKRDSIHAMPNVWVLKGVFLYNKSRVVSFQDEMSNTC
jgi:hypothetical protein